MLNTIKYSYHLKRIIKIALLFLALIIGIVTIYYTSSLADKLKAEEVKKMELWAEAMRAIADPEGDISNLSFYDRIITDNTTIPVVLARSNGKLQSRNLDSLIANDSILLRQKFERLKQIHEPIVIQLPDGENQYVYYDDSILLQKLKYYPIFQLGVVSIFLLIAYLAFSYARRSEQNKVWVGLAKETAHQLGTPMSSLMAWIDLIEDDPSQANDMAFGEMRKDVDRLKIITERFSKIGSDPVLEIRPMDVVLKNAVAYMSNRSPKLISIDYQNKAEDLYCEINLPLFEWVVENLVKNAIDSMPKGEGSIVVKLRKHKGKAVIDFTDNGSGIHPSKFKTVFKPGFTTKKRGWGLGLSLVKRIVEHYHKGLIYVKDSTLNKGTTFRIILPIDKNG